MLSRSSLPLACTALALFIFYSPTVSSQQGRIGFNTTTPAALLHVKDSNVLFTAASVLPGLPGSPPLSDAGNRFMWYANKAAFRAGGVQNSQWNKENVGQYSIAVGFNPKASGTYSMALGKNATASGTSSIAFGENVTASNDHAVAIGLSNVSSGVAATTFGFGCKATGFYSTAMGAVTESNGDNSVSMGIGTKSQSYLCLAIGRYNELSSLSASAWNADDPAFIIGDGTSNTLRSNALTILKDG